MRTAVACPDGEPERRPPLIVIYVPGGYMTTEWTGGTVWFGPPPAGVTSTAVWQYVERS